MVHSSHDALLAARWVFELVEEDLRRALGGHEASPATLAEAFWRLLGEMSVKVLVQEPWAGTIRFKTLAMLGPEALSPLILDPEGYLQERYGGGKFKINFYRGQHFLATRNFKPEGLPLWKTMDDIDA